MELTINGKQYVFIFGYRFIKELNKKNEVTERGMTLKAGLDNALMNFFSGDIETLVEMLKTANATENPRVSEKGIVEWIEENGIDMLFDLVLEELKKSEFTKKKTLNFFSGDIETLVEMLKTANATENPRVSEKGIVEWIEENGIDMLFDLVLEELKKSEFTKKKTLNFEKEVNKNLQ